MKTIIKEYGKKLLSLVLAVVMTLSLVNLAPFAEDAKAASTDVYVFMSSSIGAPAPKTNVWGGSVTPGWKEASDYKDVTTTSNGTWYKTTYSVDFITDNTIYIYDQNMTAYGSAKISYVPGPYYVVVSATNNVQLVDESTAINTYGLNIGSTEQPSSEETTAAPSGKSDVIITDISWQPENPVVGQAITFSATIKNQGDSAVVFATGKEQINGVLFKVNGVSLWSDNNTAIIQAGESITVTANGGSNGNTWTPTEAKDYEVTAQVDDQSRYGNESDTGNNTSSATIKVSAAQPTTFTFTLKDGTTGGNNGADGWLDDDSATFQVEANGQTYNMSGGSGTWTATLPTSTTSLKILRKSSDGSEIWDTWNYTGNRGDDTTFTATADGAGTWSGGSTAATYVDMDVTDVRWEPASPKAGDKVTFFATIVNNGTAATPGGDINNGVAFYIDGTKLNLWSGGNYDAIQPGKSVEVKADGGDITWTATEGPHTVMAYVNDVDERYVETDKNNNTHEETITVSASTEETTAAPSTDKTTITFKTDVAGVLADDEAIYVIEGTIAENGQYSYDSWGNMVANGVKMTPVNVTAESGEWTADIASSSNVITFVRASNNEYHYYWTYEWVNTERNGETVYTATANGAGYWGDAPTEEPSTEQPTTEAPSEVDPDSLWTGYDFSSVQYGDSSVVNNSPEQTLYLAPSILYDYKEGRPEKSNGDNYFRDETTWGSHSLNWWDQFAYFNWALNKYYYDGDGNGERTNDADIKSQMYIGAFNSAQASDQPLSNHTQRTGLNVYDWILNHNISSTFPYSDGVPWAIYRASDHASTTAGMNTALAGIASSNLYGADGNIRVQNRDGSWTKTMPYFNDAFLNQYGLANVYGEDTPVAFPFRKEMRGETTYYVFDSTDGKDNVHYNTTTNVLEYSYNSNIVKDNEGAAGFFPFNVPADSDNEDKLNYGNGLRVDIPFSIPEKSTDDADDPTAKYNYASMTLNKGDAGWGNGGAYSSEDTFTLDSIQGSKYIVLNVKEARNINIDYIKVGSTVYTLSNVLSSGATVADANSYNHTSGTTGAVYNFSGAAGYVAIPVTGNGETSVTVGYREYVESGVPMNVIVVDNTGNSTTDTTAITTAISDLQNVVVSDDIVFNFSGDDDLWVYVDGQLVLDMGGAHKMASGSINFTTGEVTVNSLAVYSNDSANYVDGKGQERVDESRSVKAMPAELYSTDKQHTLTVFYMERGLYNSNLRIEFNFTPRKLASSDAYYAELGTPIVMPVPDEFTADDAVDENKVKYTDYLKNGNYTVSYTIVEKLVDGVPTAVEEIVTDKPNERGTITYDSDTQKFTYVNTNQTNAVAEKIVITFNDTRKSTIEFTIDNYKSSDDVYVIDYGLPVELRTGDIYDLFNNDQLTLDDAEQIWELALSAKGNDNSGITSLYTATDAGLTLGTTLTIKYGDATVSGANGNSYTSYKYTLNSFLDDIDTFYYAVQVVKSGITRAALDASNATPIMTSKVTIVPANVIYYEDNFSYTTGSGDAAIIYTEGLDIVNNTTLPIQSNNQADRYGYDSQYEEQITDSLGSTGLRNGKVVEFTFKGTGVDIITRTAGYTPAVIYAVYDETGKKTEAFGIVDTLYKNGTLYQLPVISVKDLDYGTHKVKFTILDTVSSGQSGNSVFYFDGIRIYNPMNTQLIDRSGWTVTSSHNQNIISYMLDDDMNTRWHRLYQRTADGDGWVQIDMGAAYSFDTVQMLLGNSSNDWPAEYKIYVSNDGTNWGSPVASGSNTAVEEIYVGPQNARYIRIEQTGERYNNYWSIHELYVKDSRLLSDYLSTEKDVTFESVRDMVLGNCTLTETSFVDQNGNVVTNSYIPGSTATITGGQVTEDTGENASGTQNITSAVTALRSAPNNEVYLGSGSKLTFKVRGIYGVEAANRTLQVEAKLVKTGNTSSGDNYFRINGTAVTINTSTAMYYNITVPADGVITLEGLTGSGYNISLTNIKYSGYSLVYNSDTAINASSAYIKNIKVNSGNAVDSEIVATAKTRIKVDLEFSESVEVSVSNLRLYVNGNPAVYYFRDVANSSNTKITGTNIPLQIVAPNVAGIYTYKFVYTNDAGQEISKTVSVNIIPRSTRK